MNKLTYSRTIEVGPEQAELLNHLVDRYIIPMINRKIALGAMQTGGSSKTPEEELASILSFGTGKRTDVPVRRPQIKVAQGGLDARELSDIHKILSFGQPMKKEQDRQQEELVE